LIMFQNNVSLSIIDNAAVIGMINKNYFWFTLIYFSDLEFLSHTNRQKTLI